MKKFVVRSLLFVVVAILFGLIGNVRAESATSSAKVQFPITIDGAGTCNSKDECKQLCETPGNRDACTKWFQKQSFYRKPAIEQHKEEIIVSAKDKLGCGDVASCKAACGKAENKQVCVEIFLTVRKLYKDEKLVVKDVEKFKGELEKVRQELQNPGDLNKLVPGFSQLEGEKKQVFVGGQTCDSTACVKLACDKPENRQECSDLAKKFGLRGGMIGQPQNGGQNQNSLPPGCTNIEQCKQECHEKPEICKARMSPATKQMPNPGSNNFNLPNKGRSQPGRVPGSEGLGPQQPGGSLPPQSGANNHPAGTTGDSGSGSSSGGDGTSGSSGSGSGSGSEVKGASTVSGFFQRFFGFLFGF